MHSKEKEVTYITTNSYSTLNNFTDKTKNVWFVCHGLGYLSNFFIKYFTNLNANENYIIAPQAPSKYYQTSEYKHVGASWLTKINTGTETQNVLNYFDAVLNTEFPENRDFNLIILGYSQGVSVAVRYISSRKLQCEHLILHSGAIPEELESKDLDFFKGKVSLVYGTKDPYINSDRIEDEKEKAFKLFGNSITILPFEGAHEMNPKLLKSLI